MYKKTWELVYLRVVEYNKAWAYSSHLVFETVIDLPDMHLHGFGRCHPGNQSNLVKDLKKMHIIKKIN